MKAEIIREKSPRRRMLVRTVLIAIVLLAAFLRIWGFPNRYGFDADPIRDAFVTDYGATALQLPMVGPFSSLGPFTFGPWYYWQTIAFTAVTHAPFAPWIFMTVASIAFVIVMFFTGTAIYGPAFGLMAAFLAAISPPQISSARGLTNPNLISLYAGLSTLLTVLIAKNPKRSKWSGFLLGLFLGIGTNIHYQMMNLLVFIPILFLFSPSSFPQLLMAGVGFTAACIPMALFDLNNHWYTVRNMIYYSQHGHELLYVANRWLFYLRDFWPSVIAYAMGIPTKAAYFLIALTGGIIVWKAIRRDINKPMAILITSFAVNILVLRYYWGNLSVSYLQFLYPIIFLTIAYFLLNAFRAKPIAGFFLIGILVAISIPKIRDEFRPDQTYIQTGRELMQLRKTYPDNTTFRVYVCDHGDTDKAKALAYRLYKNDLLSDKGTPIGFGWEYCGYPINLHFDPKSTESAMLQSQKEYPGIPETNGADFRNATEGAILSTHYWSVTPKAVYDSTVRWWFREQP